MAGRIRLVAWQTVTEHVGARLIYVAGGFLIVLLAVSRAVGPLSAGEDVKIVKDLGLAGTEIFGVALAILTAGSVIISEAHRGILLTLLSTPVRRWEYLLGKFSGIVLALLVYTAGMGIALLTVLFSMELIAPAGAVRPAAPRAIDPRLAIALLMIAAEIALVAAVALFFSLLSSTVVIAALSTAGVFVAGQLSQDLRAFGQIADVPSWIAAPVSMLGWMLPAFSMFDVKAQVVHGLAIGARDVAFVCIYASLYLTAVLSGAAAIFSRRDLR